MSDLSWIDFSRRNDPAHPEAVNILEDKLKTKEYPNVLCFWTKSPGKVIDLFDDYIIDMQEHGTLVLMQATINNYEELEKTEMEDLIYVQY